jgi:DNA polymerase-1
MTPKTRYADWRELPYRRIFVEDSEYYPGPGLDHGGREGDLPTPLCSTVIELRSGRVQQWWQGEPNPLLPQLGPDDLYVSYFLPAEFSQRRAHGFGRPPNAIDAYTEFRRLTNDARVKSGDRPAGFYSLPGALLHLREDGLSVSGKDDLRQRIMRGPPYGCRDRVEFQHYNLDDTHGGARAIKKLVPTIESLPHALYRGEFEWALSGQEQRGIPIDMAGRERIDVHWNDIKVVLVENVDREFDCYEIVGGEPHFREEKFGDYLKRKRIEWPRLHSGALDLKARTFRDMTRSYEQLGPLHELRSVLAQLRSNRLAVGSDGRNRCLLGPFGTKTGRNAPSNSKFIFGPSKCMRFLIMPSAGSALTYRDFAQQEVRIAAIKSGDRELLAVCETGDVYNNIAKQLGYAENRPLFKTVVLGILYGLEARSLAWRVGISIAEAAEILARLRARFRTFEYFCAATNDHAGLDMVVSTNYGWTMHCPPGTSKRTLRNWPIQAAGSEIMHLFCILAERRGLPVVASIHDAFMAEGAVADIEDVSHELDRAMGDASALVLGGYRLPTDPGAGPILPGQRFYDKHGEAMWNRINQLIDG